MTWFGDIYLPWVTEKDTSITKDIVEKNFVDSPPQVFELTPDLENGTYSAILNEEVHEKNESFEEQRDAVLSMVSRHGTEFPFNAGGDIGYVLVESANNTITPSQEIQESEIEIRYFDKDDYNPAVKVIPEEYDSDDDLVGFSENWTHSLHSSFVFSVYESDGVIYSGSNDDTVRAFDSSTQTEIWSHSLHFDAIITVYEENGVVYSGANDDTVKAVNASDGSQLWSHSLHSDDIRSVYAVDDVVYSSSADGTVKAADASDGSQLWSHSLHSDQVVSIYVSDGVVYSASEDETVKAVRASDQTEIWSHSLHTGNVEAVYESDGIVYSGGNDFDIKAVDSSDGSQIWSQTTQSFVDDLVVKNGIVYVANDDGVEAFDGYDGQKLWQYPINNLSSIDFEGFNFYLGSFDDEVKSIESPTPSSTIVGFPSGINIPGQNPIQNVTGREGDIDFYVVFDRSVLEYEEDSNDFALSQKESICRVFDSDDNRVYSDSKALQNGTEVNNSLFKIDFGSADSTVNFYDGSWQVIGDINLGFNYSYAKDNENDFVALESTNGESYSFYRGLSLIKAEFDTQTDLTFTPNTGFTEQSINNYYAHWQDSNGYDIIVVRETNEGDFFTGSSDFGIQNLDSSTDSVVYVGIVPDEFSVSNYARYVYNLGKRQRTFTQP